MKQQQSLQDTRASGNTNSWNFFEIHNINLLNEDTLTSLGLQHQENSSPDLIFISSKLLPLATTYSNHFIIQIPIGRTPWIHYQQRHRYSKIQVNPQNLQDELNLPIHHPIAQEHDMMKFMTLLEKIPDKHTSTPTSLTKENLKSRMKPPGWNKDIMICINHKKTACKKFVTQKTLLILLNTRKLMQRSNEVLNKQKSDRGKPTVPN